MIVNLGLIARLLRDSGVTARTENERGCMFVVVYGPPPDYEEVATMGPGRLTVSGMATADTVDGLSISGRSQLVRISADDDETAIATAIKWFVL